MTRTSTPQSTVPMLVGENQTSGNSTVHMRKKRHNSEMHRVYLANNEQKTQRCRQKAKKNKDKNSSSEFIDSLTKPFTYLLTRAPREEESMQ
ncbi:hypothetical protein M0804_013729 [Polistes exclamans]|nr:hypothetical protein M0804_013729 [Polistes exclamans]